VCCSWTSVRVGKINTDVIPDDEIKVYNSSSHEMVSHLLLHFVPNNVQYLTEVFTTSAANNTMSLNVSFLSDSMWHRLD